MNVAIVGATGAVGNELLHVFEQRNTPVDSLRLLASPRSEGKVLTFRNRTILVEPLRPDGFDGVDVVFFSAGASISREYVPRAVHAGAVVIDNSSAFRMDNDVPLAVPEINPDALNHHRGVIAVPNCTAIILCMAVWPLHRLHPLERLVVSTYQAISGAGARALAELEKQMEETVKGMKIVPEVLPYPTVYNVFSHNTPIGPDGYNGEENKVRQETRKILGAPNLKIAITCVRVPIPRAHSEAINLTFQGIVTEDQARRALRNAPGVEVVDDRPANHFPMPIEASGRDEILVGRLRADPSQPPGKGLELFACGDQLRKGAALNAVQILETLQDMGKLKP